MSIGQLLNILVNFALVDTADLASRN